MKFGTFLHMRQIKQTAEEVRQKIESYPRMTWEEVLGANFNCIRNNDHTGMQFEGDIESIEHVGDRIFIKCKWVNVLKPYFDEDGDIREDRMEWKPWHVKETSFSINDIPRKIPNSSNVVIQCWLDHDSFPEYFTENILARVENFDSFLKF